MRKQRRVLDFNEGVRELVRKNAREYFTEFAGKCHLDWLHRLTAVYKERGLFPVYPITVLPSYYTRLEDREVSAFASLLIREDGRMADRIASFRRMMGDRPFDWFRDREYADIALGQAKDETTGGVKNFRIVSFFDKLRKRCTVVDRENPEVEGGIDTIGLRIDRMISFNGFSYEGAVRDLMDMCHVMWSSFYARLYLLVFSSSDGIGIGGLEDCLLEPLCPVTSGIIGFLGIWFPDYKKYGTFDDAVKLFGFERDSDFFYSYLAWKELCRRRPDECRKYVARYSSWYERCTYTKNYDWKKILPVID